MLKGVTRLRVISTPSLRVVKPPLKNLYPLWSVGNYATSKLGVINSQGGKLHHASGVAIKLADGSCFQDGGILYSSRRNMR